MCDKRSKGKFFKCPRCTGNQVSHEFEGDDLFHYSKVKPEDERWESFIWVSFSCMACDKQWVVKCEVNPVAMD